MLRLIEIGLSLPLSRSVDPSAIFQPGMVGQLSSVSNQAVVTVSDGRAPIGIIDDIRTASFSSNAIDEVVIAPAAGVMVGGQLVSAVDVAIPLANPNVAATSFTSFPVPVELNSRNGVITFLAGTPLNASITGSGPPDAIRTVVNYAYFVPNIPGDDSVAGSNRVSLWFQRFVGATDQYDPSARYTLGGNLFCGTDGKLTSKQYLNNLPSIAICTGLPSSLDTFLEFMLL